MRFFCFCRSYRYGCEAFIFLQSILKDSQWALEITSLNLTHNNHDNLEVSSYVQNKFAT